MLQKAGELEVSSLHGRTVPAGGEPRLAWAGLPDGRGIQFARYGAADGFPVVALHGTPGSHFKFARAAEVAAARGLCLICPDRWGYNGADVPARPRLSLYAADIEALCDGLGHARFAIIGVSGGAPFAVAVAAALGARVTRLALFAPVGPLDGLPDAEMRLFHRLSFRWLPRVPVALTALLGFYRRFLLLAPELALRAASAGAVTVDRRLIRSPAVAPYLAETFRIGMRRDVRGAVCDLQLFARRWDLDPGRVEAAARIWIGLEDRCVPQGAVRRLAAEIPGCDLVELPGAGHFWMTTAYHEILDWIATD